MSFSKADSVSISVVSAFPDMQPCLLLAGRSEADFVSRMNQKLCLLPDIQRAIRKGLFTRTLFLSDFPPQNGA